MTKMLAAGPRVRLSRRIVPQEVVPSVAGANAY